MASCDYKVDQSYSIKLVKTRFSTNLGPITMLPQLDINFHFICRFGLSEWVISKRQHSAALVRQSRRRPSIKSVVRRSLMQFMFYNQTREAIRHALGRFIDNDDDDDVEKLVEYAIVKASEIVKSKPVDRNVLDLYFSVTVQDNKVMSE